MLMVDNFGQSFWIGLVANEPSDQPRELGGTRSRIGLSHLCEAEIGRIGQGSRLPHFHDHGDEIRQERQAAATASSKDKGKSNPL